MYNKQELINKIVRTFEKWSDNEDFITSDEYRDMAGKIAFLVFNDNSTNV